MSRTIWLLQPALCDWHVPVGDLAYASGSWPSRAEGLLFGFELVHPAMLGWLAAAAAPILIHLWARRRHRQMTWAAMEYVLAAMRQTQRRLLMEHWLLLLVRTLIVVLVVLAAAEPVGDSVGEASGPGQRSHRVLVLDGSFSMGYKADDRTRFERAKEIAVRIVEAGGPGDGFTLVLLSDPPHVVVAKPSLEPQSFLRELRLVELPHTTADLPKTLREVENLLAAARRDEPRLTREEIYFLTDLGRVGWDLERLDAESLSELRQRSQRLAESAELIVIDMGHTDSPNTAVTALRCSEPVARTGQTVELQAEITQFGASARDVQPVELLVNGRSVGRKNVRLKPGSSVPVAFSYRFDSPGEYVIEVRAPGDALEIDNQRWLVVSVRDAIRVLCVEGPMGEGGTPTGGWGAGSAVSAGAAGYLALALNPTPDEPAQPIRVEVIPESRLAETDLARFDCLFAANVAQFTSGEARLLERYVRAGGGLVVFLGDRVQGERYNQELGGTEPGRLRLLPARLGPIEARPETRLDPLEYRHPLVAVFRGQERAGLLTVPVQQHVRLIVPPQAQAQVALALAGGDPLVVEEPMGRGRVVLVATSADTSWTALPVWPSFVPLVQELVRLATARQTEQRNVRVGEPLEGRWPGTAEGTVLLRGPLDRVEPLAPPRDPDRDTWIYPGTWISGVYRAEYGSTPRRVEVFAVNVPSVESDLSRISHDALRNQLGPEVPFAIQSGWQAVERSKAGGFGPPRRFAQGLLCSAVVLLLVETFLARRFGYHES